MKKGFTLIELAIVLAIIGLLIGGILVAQSMINATKSRGLCAKSGNMMWRLQIFGPNTVSSRVIPR